MVRNGPKCIPPAAAKHGRFTDEELLDALLLLAQKWPDQSVNDTARKKNLKRTTLLDYWTPIKARILEERSKGPITLDFLRSIVGKKRIGRPSILSPQEDYIMEKRVQRSVDNRQPFSRKQFAWEVSRLVKGRKGPGKRDWMPTSGHTTAWLKRKKGIISMRRFQKVGTKKVTAMDPAVIKKHFDDLAKLLTDHNMWEHLDRAWNGDETSVAVASDHGTGLGLAPTGCNVVWSKVSGYHGHVTLMVAVRANGERSPLVFIVPYVNPPEDFVAQTDKVGAGHRHGFHATGFVLRVGPVVHFVP